MPKQIAVKLAGGPDGDQIALLKEPLLEVIEEHMQFVQAYETDDLLVKGYLKGLKEMKEFIQKQ